MALQKTVVMIWTAAALALFAAPIASAQTIIFVDDDAGPGGDGATWGTAYEFLQDALADAAGQTPPVEVHVAQGTYKPDQGAVQTPGDREATFALINGVAIMGGYAGPLGGPDPDVRDVELFETILSGDLLGDDLPGFVNNGENAYHVVTSDSVDETAVVDGVTVTGGNAADTFGGGMINGSSSPIVTNCTFSGNTAGSGGGMFNSGDSIPTVTNCTFSGNTADVNAGGMYNWDISGAMVSNCTFSGNTAFSGGGMYNDGSNPTVTNCTFSENTAHGGGGGMYNRSGSSPTVTNCAFSGNSSNFAAAMLNSSSSPIVSNCTFSENSSDGGGSGMYNTGSSPTVTNCAFSGNTASFEGGGMDNVSGSSPTVTNCTFSGNTASFGGGMYNLNSNPTVTNCTFSGNTASNLGGGMWNNTSSPTVTNCILWDNTPDQLDDNPSTTVTYSNIEGGWTGAGSNNIDLDPSFVDPANGDLRLDRFSPCTDAGDNTAVPPDTLDLDGDGDTAEPIPRDLAGNLRFFNDANVLDTGSAPGGGAIVDMGALERVVDSIGIEFELPQEFPATGAPNVEATGRFNDDAFIDVVVAIPGSDSMTDGSIQVFLNLGNDVDGQWLGLVPLPPVPVGREPSSLAVGDFNGDLDLDVAVANAGDDNVFVFLGNGDGTFEEPEIVVPVGDEPTAIVAGRFNGDTAIDLAVGNAGDGTVLVFVNDGSAMFAALGDPILIGPGHLAMELDPEDVEDPKDLDLDLYVANAALDTVTVLRNIGAGVYMALPPITVGAGPVDLTVADLNGDDLPDIATANFDDDTVSVILNTGGDTYMVLDPALEVGDMPVSIDAVDLDGDGDPDLVVVAVDEVIGPSVQVLENLFDEVEGLDFGPPVATGVGADPTFVIGEDFNNDDAIDLVTVNTDEEAGGSVTVLLNRPPCFADVDHDGVVDVDDLIEVIVNWGPCPPPAIACPGNVNGDDVVDVEDLVAIITAWGECP